MENQPTNQSTRLYRYLRGEYAVQAIEEGFLKIGRLAEVNDPFEFRPAIVGLPKGTPQEAIERRESFFIKKLNDSVGILCFSDERTVTDPVVWSHYSEGHRGIALGFEYPNLGRLVELGKFIHVTYLDERVLINDYEFSQGHTAKNLEVAKALLGRKAKNWGYEREYRLFVDLRGPKVVTRNGMYWHDIPKDKLVEVVPGCRCPIDDEYLRKALKDGGFTRAVVRRAKLSQSQFEVELPS